MSGSAAVVAGTYDPRFAPVRDVFAQRLAAGEEVGASLAVQIGGRAVVDLWGGHLDRDRATPWGRDTVVNVWSTTKTITALAALTLIDRGVLDPFAPVEQYWPEFGAAGKGSVQVRHVLGHTSGVSGWDEPFSPDQLLNHDYAAARLAAQHPWWEPGTASGYHSTSYGTLIGELVRRTSEVSLGSYIRSELADPLGADFQLGVRPSDRARVGRIIPPPPADVDMSAIPPDSVMFKTFSTAGLKASSANTPAWQDAEVGAANGHTNARALATLLSTVACNGATHGRRLLSRDTVDLIFEEQAAGRDLVLGIPVRWGVGMALGNAETIPYLAGHQTAFWTGWGGSAAIADRERELSIGYAMNKMSGGFIGSERLEAYITAIYDSLDSKSA